MRSLALSEEEIKRFNESVNSGYVRRVSDMINRYRESFIMLARSQTRFNNIDFEECSYSTEDMVNICIDFFGQFDGELQQKLITILNNPEIKIEISQPQPNNRDNKSFCRSGDDGRALFIHPENNIILGLIVVCHEFAHMLSQRMQENGKPKDGIIGEVESLFIERVFVNYLTKKGIISQKVVENYNKTRTNGLLNDIEYCGYRNEVINLARGLNKEKLAELEGKLANNKNGDCLLDILNSLAKNGYDFRERYVVGEIGGRVLFERYLKDRQGTTEKFKNYLAHNCELDLGETLQNLLGQGLNDTYKEYMSILEKDKVEMEQE